MTSNAEWCIFSHNPKGWDYFPPHGVGNDLCRVTTSHHFLLVRQKIASSSGGYERSTDPNKTNKNL